MIRFFSPRTFSLVFGLGYTVAIVGNYPLFRYYPLVGRYSLTDLVDLTLGPAMSWYGWMGYAAVVAVIASLIVPKRLDDKIWAGVFYVLPLIIFLGGYYREQSWFTGPGG